MLNSESLVSFVTTFLGAFLALGLTYLYDRHKATGLEDSERRKVLSTIRHELAATLKQIENAEKDAPAYDDLGDQLNVAKSHGPGHLAVMPDVRFARFALETALFSGKLFLLDQESLEAVTEDYRRIDVVNRSSDDLRAIARGPVDQRYVPMIANLIGTVNGTMKNLRESIPLAIRMLDERLGDQGVTCTSVPKQRDSTRRKLRSAVGDERAHVMAVEARLHPDRSHSYRQTGRAA